MTLTTTLTHLVLEAPDRTGGRIRTAALASVCLLIGAAGVVLGLAMMLLELVRAGLHAVIPGYVLVDPVAGFAVAGALLALSVGGAEGAAMLLTVHRGPVSGIAVRAASVAVVAWVVALHSTWPGTTWQLTALVLAGAQVALARPAPAPRSITPPRMHLPEGRRPSGTSGAPGPRDRPSE